MKVVSNTLSLYFYNDLLHITRYDYRDLTRIMEINEWNINLSLERYLIKQAWSIRGTV